MASAYKGNLDIFKLLLEFGSNPQLTNKTNMTARDWALMFNRKKNY
jgi:ankyrin repeat protein